MCLNFSNATSHTPTTPVKITPFRLLNESHSITMEITFVASYNTKHS